MSHLARLLLLLLLTYQLVVQAADAPSESCVNGHSKRTIFNIVWACVATIICAWPAIYPNILPRESPFKRTLRRIELMFWTAVAPEILSAYALNQRLAAMTIRDVYNDGKGVFVCLTSSNEWAYGKSQVFCKRGTGFGKL